MNISRLFMKKPLKEEQQEAGEGQGLKKSLGSLQLTSIGLGAIIGAGIFVIIGPAAALYAGPGIAIAYIIAAIICVFAGLCYAELSSLIPASGGVYSYSYIAMGEFAAWIVGWALVAQYLFSLSTVAVGWSGYCISICNDFGIHLPPLLSNSPIVYTPEGGWQLSGTLINLPALILVGLLGILISAGINAAAQFNNIMVIIKMTTIALFIVLGLSFIHSENWVPMIPENTGIFGEFGWSGILRASGLLFFAYIGFDSVSTLAQEAKNPQRDLPRGILGSLAISTLAYITISLVLTGVVSYKLLNVPDPMSIALDAMGSSFLWLKSVVKFAILAALTSVVLVQLIAITRIVISISYDGLLPKEFGTINKKTQTPLFSSIVATLICMVISGLFPVNVLGALVSMNTLLQFAIVCLGVLILRYTHPNIKRPFKVPLVPLIPILGIIACIGQMIFLPLGTWIQLIAWFFLGLVVYFTYSIHNSKLHKAKHH